MPSPGLSGGDPEMKKKERPRPCLLPLGADTLVACHHRKPGDLAPFDSRTLKELTPKFELPAPPSVASDPQQSPCVQSWPRNTLSGEETSFITLPHHPPTSFYRWKSQPKAPEPLPLNLTMSQRCDRGKASSLVFQRKPWPKPSPVLSF